MKMTKLATLFLTATLTLASGSVLAAQTGTSDSNGDANAAAAAGQVAPDAKQNVAPNNVDNNQINNGSTNTATGSTMLHPNGTDSGTMSHDGMTTDEVHKNTMCKDGRCPDPNDKVGSDADTKTDGTTQ
ncbi:protein YbgS [Enterobacter sp. UNJFSC 003]|uniref:protein YbgS n=1 Tax=Enterobacter sp. UNJFSC 003 TaxID=3122077 RepID=UPI002EAF9B95|nr:protein YbgS [Serratia liquefaciens]